MRIYISTYIYIYIYICTERERERERERDIAWARGGALVPGHEEGQLVHLPTTDFYQE